MQSTRSICCVAGAAISALFFAASAASFAQSTPRAYSSAFDTYRPWQSDTAAADWRAANSTVQKLNGHAGHMRGNAPAEAAARPQGQHGTHEPKKEHEPMHHEPMHGGTMQRHGPHHHHSKDTAKPADSHQHTEPRK